MRRVILKLLNNLSDTPKPPPQNLTTDNKKGNLLKSVEEVENRWRSFLSDKFKTGVPFGTFHPVKIIVRGLVLFLSMNRTKYIYLR